MPDHLPRVRENLLCVLSSHLKASLFSLELCYWPDVKAEAVTTKLVSAMETQRWGCDTRTSCTCR